PAAPAVAARATGPAARPPEAGKAKPAELGNAAHDAADFAMHVRLSPTGAGLDRVKLNAFKAGDAPKSDQILSPEVAPEAGDDRYTFQGRYADPRLAFTRPLATRNIVVNGTPLDLSNAVWSLEGDPRTVDLKVPLPAGGAQDVKAQQVVYTTVVALPNAAGELVDAVRLRKTFTLLPKPSATQGYEVWLDHGFENLTNEKLTVAAQINGPTLPPRENRSAPDRHVFAGYQLAGGTTMEVQEFAAAKFSDVVPGFPLHEQGPKPTEKGPAPLTWAGVSSAYFDAFVHMPDPAAFASVVAQQQDISTTKDPELRPIVMTFQTRNLELPPASAGAAAAASVRLETFLGPRWRKLLDADEKYYSAAPRGYDKTLIVKQGMCSICAVDQLITGMVLLLNGLHWVAGGFAHKSPAGDYGDWGIAIILLVAIVRTCLHPITKRSQVQMMKMGEMGPALQKLKEKYGDDKEAFAKAQMEVMKSQGFAPILGCLPIFLQTPIWIALWQALQSTFELRQAPFLWGFTWIKDLSKPDFLVKFADDVPLAFGLHLSGINLLPLLLAGVFHVQARIQNAITPATTPEQESQKKMMMWMSTVMFPLFLYNGPSGLNLYIITSTLVGIVESKIIRDHIKQRKAAEAAAAPVVVDARPTRAARKAQATRKEEPPTPKGGVMGFLAKLQQRAEELQREAEKKNNKRTK
ncbi:MAG TPA: membrane protein insertase YidC, partial [Humisphaera sp.]